MTARHLRLAISRPQRARAGALGEYSVQGARLTDGRARQEAGGRLCAGRAGLPGLCRRHRRCVRPRIPGLSPGWSGAPPHVLRFPRRAFLRFPVCPPGSPPRPPSPGFPSSGVLQFVLRPLPGSGSPSVSLRIPFPSSSLYLTAAAGRFPGHWSRAAGTKVTSSAATPSPGIARSARTRHWRTSSLT